MNVTITPKKLRGSIIPPPSKSQSHRLVIAAALSEGSCTIGNIAFSEDVQATLDCMVQLGAKWELVGDKTITITGLKQGSPVLQADGLPHFDCGESGSTLRFIIPIALAVCGGGVFTGRGRLMSRPQQPYFDMFKEKGISYDLTDGVLTVRGQLPSGKYFMPGDISSQFFTGLLYAAPLVQGTSIIRATTKLESRSYLDMTLDNLRDCGLTVMFGEDTYVIPGNQTYTMKDSTVEADWSQAGFYCAAKGLGNQIGIFGMNLNSKQGDRAAAWLSDRLRRPGNATLDMSDCPDLVPPMAAQAALREEGLVTHLTNAARLRMKESDRLAAVTSVLTAMGADVEEQADGLVIRGKKSLAGGVTVDSFGDHRIAMMAAMAATRCEQPVTITGAECVNKSYPNFWEDYVSLGGEITYD